MIPRHLPKVPFNMPYMTGKELHYIAQAHFNGRLSGGGPFTERCQRWLESCTGARLALLTHSCTAALELASLLFDFGPGDEVIMPSYTFVSTANAFVLRGAVPVFVDIRRDTLNLDETLIEGAITPRTRAIVPVHYAGIACEMDSILACADKRGLIVIEDAAQGVMAEYKGRALGSMGHAGAFSFHETKHITCGEGGALLVSREGDCHAAEIIVEKGTDRTRYFRGQVDRYTWQRMGSSLLPSELTAAFLWAQLEEAVSLTTQRRALWNRYHTLLAPLEARGLLTRPVIPEGCTHNAHMYYVLLPRGAPRDALLARLHTKGVQAVFHYVPLHSSQGGKRYGRVYGTMAITDDVAARLVRLPLWIRMTADLQEHVVDALHRELNT